MLSMRTIAPRTPFRLLAAAAAGIVWLAASSTAGAKPLQRWLYYPVNLAVDDNITRLQAIFQRASASGYTHVVLGDSKFGHIWEMESRYFRNIEKVKQIAADNRLEIIPMVFPVGYSNDLLWNDPNLVEGLPVKGARFVVHGGKALPDSKVSLKGGKFERASDWDWKDENMIVADGVVSVTDPNGQNARIVQRLRLEPFHAYHVEVEVKTSSFQGTPEVKILAEERSLNFADLKVKPTQDWTLHHVVFNSLGSTQANLYLGAWGAGRGSLSYRNARISESGLVNLIRRPGAPFLLKTEAGVSLTEGKDYSPVRDPFMGSRPWNGEYEVWHEPPALETHLPDGTALFASYHHAITVGDGQAMICLSEPKTTALLRRQARELHQAWGARQYMMSFDEIRVMNWCEACQARHLSPGRILAQTARDCEKFLREQNPGVRICVWSDMFDPSHNAHGNYYLVNGDLAGSWDGLSPQTTILQWNFDKRDESMAWFARRGHHQVIAGYYDHDPADVGNWLRSAASISGVDAVMYTTWTGNYSDLEKFASLIH